MDERSAREGRTVRWAARSIVIALLATIGFWGLAVGTPNPAAAEGERVVGTLQTSRSGPIEGLEVTVETEAGEEIGTVETDEDGRFEIDLPGPGTYVVSIDTENLPEAVELGGADTRTVEVGLGRSQPVNFALDDGSANAGSSTVQAVQLLVDGLRFGLLIALCAVGLSLIFGTTGLTNFAHGELVTIGAILAYIFNVGIGLPLIAAAALAVLAGGLVGAVNELALWRPLRRRGTGLIAALVISIGLSLAVRYFFQVFYGGFSNPYRVPTERANDYGLFTMTDRDLLSIVICIVVLLLIAVMLQRTKIGKAMRAVADNRDLASASGINVNRVILVVWVMGGALAALGGILLGLSDQIQWDMGFRLLLLMFAGVTLGGLGTAYGALLGSVIVGVFIQMSTLVIPDDMKYVGGLLLLIVVLVIRPQGILGSRARVG